MISLIGWWEFNPRRAALELCRQIFTISIRIDHAVMMHVMKNLRLSKVNGRAQFLCWRCDDWVQCSYYLEHTSHCSENCQAVTRQFFQPPACTQSSHWTSFTLNLTSCLPPPQLGVWKVLEMIGKHNLWLIVSEHKLKLPTATNLA